MAFFLFSNQHMLISCTRVQSIPVFQLNQWDSSRVLKEIEILVYADLYSNSSMPKNSQGCSDTFKPQGIFSHEGSIFSISIA